MHEEQNLMIRFILIIINFFGLTKNIYIILITNFSIPKNYYSNLVIK